MKKLMVIFILIICSTELSLAQRFGGGILAGLNASQVDGDSYNGYHKPGIVAGGYVFTDLNSRLFATMEIKFAQKGSRKNPNPKTGDQEKYIMRLNYIDVPFYLGIRTGENLSVLGGISVGYFISGAEFDNYGQFPDDQQYPFNDFDYQALLGFRYQFSDRLSIELRGSYSFIPIRDSPGDELWYWRDNQFNNVLTTSVFYRLDF
jgi:opacity protein-like surface antigen